MTQNLTPTLYMFRALLSYEFSAMIKDMRRH